MNGIVHDSSGSEERELQMRRWALNITGTVYDSSGNEKLELNWNEVTCTQSEWHGA